SRRRHTRLQGDWSSDVCSSDLGDSSGHWLFEALYRSGFASQPTAVARDDGLALTDCYISAVGRCAPPGNKPSHSELERCRPYLRSEERRVGKEGRGRTRPVELK